MTSLMQLSKPTGHIIVRQEDPEIAIFQDAVYLPFSSSPNSVWGLFDQGYNIIQNSYDFRENPLQPSYQSVISSENQFIEPHLNTDCRYIYCGNFAPHYGHFLINTLPRLWFLLTDRGSLPPLLYHGPTPHEAWSSHSVYSEILQRLGLKIEELRTFTEPVRLREVVVPASSLQEENFVHTAFGRLCDHIAHGLYQDNEIGCETRPAYLSKTRLTSGVRRFVNEDVMEDRLSRGGVDILYPEKMTFAEQIRLFAKRRTIIGSIGSAFHTAAFAPPGRHLIVLCPTPNFSATFALIDALRGHRAHYYSVDTNFVSFKSSFHLDFTLQDPQGVAEAILRRLDYRGDLEEYDNICDMRNTRSPLQVLPFSRWSKLFEKIWKT